MILLVGGEKGGTGKTTVATNLAAVARLKGRDVLLIDTDRQGSASSWAATRQHHALEPVIPSVQKFGNTLHTQVLDLNKRYQEVIIDAGGRDSIELRSAMTVAQYFYVPIQTSQFDIWTLGLIHNLVTDVKIVNPNLQTFILLNRCSTNPSVNEVTEAKEILKEFENLKLSTCTLKDRIAYRKAAKNGQSVLELEKKDEKAIQEITLLYQEVYNGQ